MAGIAGAVLIATGLVGGGLAGVYVDKTKKFQETAKISYGLAAISCCLLTIVSRTIGPLCCFGFHIILFCAVSDNIHSSPQKGVKFPWGQTPA